MNKNTGMIDLIINYNMNTVQIDVKCFPVLCPECGNYLKELFNHNGSRYGQVGEVQCDCGEILYLVDGDNIVDFINISNKNKSLKIDFYKLFRLTPNDFKVIKSKYLFDIFKLNGDERLPLSELADQLENRVGKLGDSKETIFPTIDLIDKWFRILDGTAKPYLRAFPLKKVAQVNDKNRISSSNVHYQEKMEKDNGSHDFETWLEGKELELYHISNEFKGDVLIEDNLMAFNSEYPFSISLIDRFSYGSFQKSIQSFRLPIQSLIEKDILDYQLCIEKLNNTEGIEETKASLRFTKNSKIRQICAYSVPCSDIKLNDYCAIGFEIQLEDSRIIYIKYIRDFELYFVLIGDRNEIQKRGYYDERIHTHLKGSVLVEKRILYENL